MAERGGWRRRSQVHQIEAGHHLSGKGGRLIKVETLNGTAVEDYGPISDVLSQRLVGANYPPAGGASICKAYVGLPILTCGSCCETLYLQRVGWGATNPPGDRTRFFRSGRQSGARPQSLRRRGNCRWPEGKLNDADHAKWQEHVCRRPRDDGHNGQWFSNTLCQRGPVPCRTTPASDDSRVSRWLYPEGASGRPWPQSEYYGSWLTPNC